MTKNDVIQALELASVAYKNEQPSPPQGRLTVIDDPHTDIQCYVRQYGRHLSITFRGSDSLKDWKTDLTFWKKTIPYGNFISKIRVHTGFINAYKAPSVRDTLHGFITDQIKFVHIAGHSYGAALAVLCGVDLEYNFPYKDYEVFLFGCPRVGNAAFKKSYNKRVFKTLRVENGNDIVTKVPFALWGYRHVGIRVHVGPPRIFGAFSFEEHRPQSYYSHVFCNLLP